MHLIPGFAYTAAATVFIDRLRQLGLQVGSESKDISRLCYLPNPSIPSAYTWFHQPGEPFMWDEDFHNAAALIMAEERRTGEDSDNTGGAGLFEERYPSAWMLEYLGMHRNGNHFHHPSQSNPTYATIAWPNRGWSTLSDTVAGIFGRKWGDSFDLFASQIAPSPEYAKAARIALPYGWQIGQDPFETLNFHKQQGEWLWYYGHVNSLPLGPGAAEKFAKFTLEEAAKAIELIPPEVTEGEWDIPLPDGNLGLLISYIHQQSRKPITQYAIALALFFAAGLTGRRFLIDGTGLNLYIILGGGTSSGKGEAHRITESIRADLRLIDQSNAIDDIFGHSVAVSGQGLRKMMTKGKPNKAVYKPDGDGVLRDIISESGVGPILKDTLLEIWVASAINGELKEVNYSKEENTVKAVARPALTMLIDTQVEPLKQFIGSGVAYSSGLGSRTVMIEYDGLIKHTVEQPYVPLATVVLTTLANILSAFRTNPEQMVHVQWADGVKEQHQQYDRANTDRMNRNKAISGYLGRTPMNVQKIAAIQAVLENPNAPVITQSQWEWARRVMTRATARIEQMLLDGETGGGEAIRGALAVKAIREYTKMDPELRIKYKTPKSVAHVPEVIPEVYFKQKLRHNAAFKGTDNGKTTEQIIEQTIAQLVKDDVIVANDKSALAAMYGIAFDARITTKFYTLSVNLSN